MAAVAPALHHLPAHLLHLLVEGEQIGRRHALLGQGRCLCGLGRPEAELPLCEARDLFAAMGYKPALAETEALLEQAAPAPTS